MKKFLFASLLVASFNAYGQSPTPLSPNWFSSLYQAFSEDTSDVWRGEVIGQNNTTLIIKNSSSGKEVNVNLLHITYPKNASSKQVNYANKALSDLIGSQVYVLGDDDSKSINAKIIDYVGADLNLSLVTQGFFDVNETTLFLKKEKQQYLNALSYAKISNKGIWN